MLLEGSVFIDLASIKCLLERDSTVGLFVFLGLVFFFFHLALSYVLGSNLFLDADTAEPCWAAYALQKS